MENYICINGNKTVLTDEQVQKLGLSFCGRTAAQISEIIKSGKARDHFSIHDVINLHGYELEVIGFDHDKVSGNPDAPTMTVMAKTLLPARRIHGSSCRRGWVDTELRQWLNNEFINQLPDELLQHIPAVVKVTHNFEGDPFETVDSLFLPSESELFGSAIWAACEDGARYEAFATSADRIRVDEDGAAEWYWTRSASGGTSTSFAIVCYHGYASSSSASGTSIRAPLCFCLA